jgi:uncharacterized ion transporter superfamily protein YfcC
MTSHAASPATRRMPHALVMMLLIITAAVALTYVVPSGAFERTKAGLVVPGTYHLIPKHLTATLITPKKSTDSLAYAAAPISVVTSIPAGMVKAATLIMMILFVGGMFGILDETGALTTGIDHLVHGTKGNVGIVVPAIMIVIACGSTFLGLISEYLVLIPMMVLLAERLGYNALFGVAIVTIAAKIGYLTSITNPLALVVAQPLVGVPVFSGAGFRAVLFVIFLPLGIWYLLRRAPSMRTGEGAASHESSSRLSARHIGILMALLAAVAAMIAGVRYADWGNPELASMFVLLSLVLAVIGGLGSRPAAQAFLKGMQGMLLAAVLVGLASAVEIVLKDALVLDSIINGLASAIEGKHPAIVSQLMMGIQLVIDVLIPSTSGKAAVTMPILGPIGQLAGVSGQVIVQAFLFGNGLMNTVTPTSGMLLAYLAAGKVNFGDWIKFILPLFGVLLALSAAALFVLTVFLS